MFTCLPFYGEFTCLRSVHLSTWSLPVYLVFTCLHGVNLSTWCLPVYVVFTSLRGVHLSMWRLPVYVELLGKQLPVLALGVGRVEGGTDALMDGRGGLEG